SPLAVASTESKTKVVWCIPSPCCSRVSLRTVRPDELVHLDPDDPNVEEGQLGSRPWAQKLSRASCQLLPPLYLGDARLLMHRGTSPGASHPHSARS
ncbi:MAG: hypothetical protein QXT33_07745, partial [Thermofilum sp.]